MLSADDTIRAYLTLLAIAAVDVLLFGGYMTWRHLHGVPYQRSIALTYQAAMLVVCGSVVIGLGWKWRRPGYVGRTALLWLSGHEDLWYYWLSPVVGQMHVLLLGARQRAFWDPSGEAIGWFAIPARADVLGVFPWFRWLSYDSGPQVIVSGNGLVRGVILGFLLLLLWDAGKSRRGRQLFKMRAGPE